MHTAHARTHTHSHANGSTHRNKYIYKVVGSVYTFDQITTVSEFPWPRLCSTIKHNIISAGRTCEYECTLMMIFTFVYVPYFRSPCSCRRIGYVLQPSHVPWISRLCSQTIACPMNLTWLSSSSLQHRHHRISKTQRTYQRNIHKVSHSPQYSVKCHHLLMLCTQFLLHTNQSHAGLCTTAVLWSQRTIPLRELIGLDPHKIPRQQIVFLLECLFDSRKKQASKTRKPTGPYNKKKRNQKLTTFTTSLNSSKTGGGLIKQSNTHTTSLNSSKTGGGPTGLCSDARSTGSSAGSVPLPIWKCARPVRGS